MHVDESEVNSKEFLLKQVFESVSQKMSIDFKYLSSQIEHGPSKGTARERIVKEFLLDRLPESLEIGTGEIIDCKGQHSRQIDLVIFDKLRCPNLVQFSDIRVYPAECVHGVMEVKSKLDIAALKNSVENIRSAKRLSKSAYCLPTRVADEWRIYGKSYDYFPMMGYVFAFESIDLERLGKELDNINTSTGIPPDEQIDVICLLDRGLIAHNNSQGKLISWAEPTDIEVGETTVTGVRTKRALLLFYVMLHDQLSIAKTRPIKMVDYLPKTFIFGDDED